MPSFVRTKFSSNACCAASATLSMRVRPKACAIAAMPCVIALRLPVLRDIGGHVRDDQQVALTQLLVVQAHAVFLLDLEEHVDHFEGVETEVLEEVPAACIAARLGEIGPFELPY